MTTPKIALVGKKKENENLFLKIFEHLQPSSTVCSTIMLAHKHGINFDVTKSFVVNDSIETQDLLEFSDLHVIFAEDNHEALQLINRLYFAPKSLGKIMKFMLVLMSDSDCGSGLIMGKEQITLSAKVVTYYQCKFNKNAIKDSSLDQLMKNIISEINPKPKTDELVESKINKLVNLFGTVTIKELNNSDNMAQLVYVKNLLNMKLSDCPTDKSNVTRRIKELVEGIETITVKEFLDPTNDVDLKVLKESFNKHIN